MSISPTVLALSRLRRYLRAGVPTLYSLIWMGLGVLAVCTLVGAVLHLSHTYATERTATERIERQLHQAEAERDRLAGRLHYLRSPEGQVATATEHGWVKPGDQAVSFSPQPQSTAPAPSTTAAEDTTVGGLVLAALALFLLAFLIGIGLLIYRWRAPRQTRPAGVLTPRSELNRRPAPGR